MSYIYHFLKSHPIETVLLSLALILTAASTVSYMQEETQAPPEILSAISNEAVEPPSRPTQIIVDISGAVLKPDIYEVSDSARLAEVIKIAGGLQADADTGYIARNFNMARYLSDQEKIYIPTKKDIESGRFQEPSRTLEYLISDAEAPNNETVQPSENANQAALISVNDATKEELDMLPGVGPTTAQKIIDSRPHATLEELLSKKAVKQSVFEKIKDLISL